ncbi:MAG: protein kinase domain-containing protein [Gemmataceae bacterium]
MIDLLCTHCGTAMRVRPEQARSAGRCPRCHRVVEAPRDGGPGTKSSRADVKGTFESAADSVAPGETDYLGKAEAAGELGRLNKYRVLRLIGSGAMGMVFEAEDTVLNRRVALKVMKKARAKKAANRDEFLREARATAAIEHDHIVTIYDVGEDLDREMPYLAMKLLVGESLEDRLNRDSPLDPEEVIRIGREIAEGLAAAHEHGLIHRDIKPANIWLEEGRDRVKILDFGLAREAENAEADEAEKNLLIGTPLYMSPEQARGGEIDARTDLFAVGAVLYRAATGELPFKGRTARVVLDAVKRETPKSPREVNPSVPPYLSRLIMDLLEKSPDDRPMTARHLIVALGEALDRVDEVPPADDEPVEAEAEAEAGEGRGQRRRPKPRKPRRKGPAEYTLEGRVIWWSVFTCVSVAVLLAIVHGVRTFLAR